MAFEVTFDVNGSPHTVTVGSVKIGNSFLRCKGRGKRDDELVALVPLDSILCIAHESLSMSPASVDDETA